MDSTSNHGCRPHSPQTSHGIIVFVSARRSCTKTVHLFFIPLDPPFSSLSTYTLLHTGRPSSLLFIAFKTTPDGAH